MSFIKRFEVRRKIEHLSWLHKTDPEDYMVKFELEELQQKLDRLIRIDRLGLKLILGGKHSSNLCTENKRETS